MTVQESNKQPCDRHKYRLIECKNDRDTLKCEDCGKIITESCNFDDDYS